MHANGKQARETRTAARLPAISSAVPEKNSLGFLPPTSSCSTETARCVSNASVSTFLNSKAQNMGPRPSPARCCAYSRFWISWLTNASVLPLELACQSAVSAGVSSKTCSAHTADKSATRAMERMRCDTSGAQVFRMPHGLWKRISEIAKPGMPTFAI